MRDPSDLRGAAGQAVDEVIAALDVGKLRVAEPSDGGWVTHAWIKEAILLYFRRSTLVSRSVGGTPPPVRRARRAADVLRQTPDQAQLR